MLRELEHDKDEKNMWICIWKALSDYWIEKSQAEDKAGHGGGEAGIIMSISLRGYFQNSHGSCK